VTPVEEVEILDTNSPIVFNFTAKNEQEGDAVDSSAASSSGVIGNQLSFLAFMGLARIVMTQRLNHSNRPESVSF